MLNKKLSPARSATVVLIGCLGLVVGALAQEKILDFYGEVNEENRAGYKDYVEMGCWQCHAFQGQSSSGFGPKIAPGPLPYEAFALLVRKPANVMPAYSSNVLSDEKLRRIYDYLDNLPDAPDPSDIPLLSGK